MIIQIKLYWHCYRLTVYLNACRRWIKLNDPRVNYTPPVRESIFINSNFSLFQFNRGSQLFSVNLVSRNQILGNKAHYRPPDKYFVVNAFCFGYFVKPCEKLRKLSIRRVIIGFLLRALAGVLPVCLPIFTIRVNSVDGSLYIYVLFLKRDVLRRMCLLFYVRRLQIVMFCVFVIVDLSITGFV